MTSPLKKRKRLRRRKKTPPYILTDVIKIENYKGRVFKSSYRELSWFRGKQGTKVSPGALKACGTSPPGRSGEGARRMLRSPPCCGGAGWVAGGK